MTLSSELEFNDVMIYLLEKYYLFIRERELGLG